MIGGLVEGADAALVLAVLAGDASAFSSLYHAHVRAVTTVVRDNVHDRESIADVVQEVFSRALERLPTLREPDHFRPWLLSIARHAAVDERRRQSRSDAVGDDAADEGAAVGMGPDEQAELGELCRLVRAKVAGLSRRDATALSLVLHLGYTPPQVAAVLGVSPGAAKVLLHRARLRLRDAVALELLARSRSTECDQLQALVAADDALAAARHVHRCSLCLRTATEEVQLYEWPERPTTQLLSDQGQRSGRLDPVGP